MRRRDFVKLFAGSATTWPLAARAQQGEQVRRIGMLWPFSADDPRGKASLAALQQALRQLGWTEGRNLRIDARWFAGNPDDNRKNAAELIALAPDLIFFARKQAEPRSVCKHPSSHGSIDRFAFTP
ncbi:MAG: hypothetical protein WCC77_25505 [Pseudolabrys sp.]